LGEIARLQLLNDLKITLSKPGHDQLTASL
jgi:hypothetical protein